VSALTTCCSKSIGAEKDRENKAFSLCSESHQTSNHPENLIDRLADSETIWLNRDLWRLK
jgi:hypothetical protein